MKSPLKHFIHAKTGWHNQIMMDITDIMAKWIKASIRTSLSLYCNSFLLLIVTRFQILMISKVQKNI